MAAPKGNQYYLLRSKDGRDKIFKTPEELANACNEYFQWCLDNPLKEAVLHQRTGEILNLPKMRPFTIQGLCNFIDVSLKCFKDYEKRKDFVAVTMRARQIIYNQKFEGAAAGFLKENLIARDLGLKEKSENETTQKIEIKVDEDLKNDLDKL